MTKAEKYQFVRQLTRSIVRDVEDHLRHNRLPKEWDGHELREYLADKFNESRSRYLTGTRKADYNNEILVRNL